MAWDIADYPFTQEQWYTMCDSGLSRPVQLGTQEAEDTLPTTWVYYRPWGLMFVPFGDHQRAMATLWAFHHGYADIFAAAEAEGIARYRMSETLADRFLDLDGTAFRSSAGDVITVGRADRLDSRERAAFRPYTIRYLD